MIPPTPLLLVAAAHALSRQTVELPRRWGDAPCSLEFVWELGKTTHFDLLRGQSSWPVPRVRSVLALRSAAEARGWCRQRAEAGDLLLFRDEENDQRWTVGVVMVVLDRRLSQDGRVRWCALAWAREAEGNAMRVETGMRWVNTEASEIAIRWSATPDELERAA
jgi:hypothetical protein